MPDIIEIYKNRLINISSSNKSVQLRKLPKKSHFDLTLFNEINEKISSEIYEFITKRDNKDIEIMEDPYKKREYIIKCAQNQPKEKKEALHLAAENIYKKMIAWTGNLKTMLQNISVTEKETGRNELYLGYPFAEGLCKDGTLLRAPIMLFPVSLENKQDTWIMINSVDQPILLNKSFIFAYCKCNEEKIGKFETEFDSLEIFGDNILAGLQKYLEENGIKISLIEENYSNDKTTELFTEMKKSDKQSFYQPGNIQIKRFMILGQYPVSGSIYNDYMQLQDQLLDNSLIKSLLINEPTADSLRDFQLSESIKNEDIKESEYYFLSKLDNSQEKALASADQLSNLVIFGPPGTGKSQTLSNIVANSLCKGKKVLVVSQKRAAIDVVYNRLSEVSEKLMLVHDSNKDKKNFYLKVLSSLEYKANYSDSSFADFEDISAKIDSKIKMLNTLFNTLHSDRPFGLSLQQMYTKIKKLTDNRDERLLLLNEFRKNKVLIQLTYKQLNESLKNFTTEIIKDFLRKKEFDTNIFAIPILKENYDSICQSELELFLTNIECAIEKLVKISKNEPFTCIIRDICKNNFIINNSDIMEQSRAFFKKENEWLKDPIKGKGISIVLTYFKNKKQEKENNKKYLENEVLHENLTVSVVNELLSIKNIIFENNEFINDEFLLQMLQNILCAKSSFSEYQSSILKAASFIDEHRKLEKSLGYYQGSEKDLFEFCYNNSAPHDISGVNAILGKMEEIALLYQINMIEKNEDVSIIDKYSVIKKDISDWMLQKNKMTIPRIKKKWSKPITNIPKYKEMVRVANLKRKTWTLRKYISEFQDILLDLFPCWLLSPGTVSEIMPLKPALFDVILFDEASQMFIEDAIPSIFRAKKIVISGDDKQLQPSRGIVSSYTEEDDDEYDEQTQSAKEEQSLLDVAKANFQKIMLNYHYRAKYEELINFSNHAFYGGKLQTAPNVVKSNKRKEAPPIKRIKINGVWDKMSNEEEAKEVVALVYNILVNRKEEETIGIITFNIRQKEMIMDLMERKAANDTEFSLLYNKEFSRTNNGEDISLFVKNIENVQGDERDIIIFSTAYAKNLEGRLSVNFGSLSQKGGENRLNVAVSRAKKGIYLITSIEPEELKVEDSANLGPKLFKKYLEYAKYISENQYDAANTLLLSLSDTEKHSNNTLHFDSPFENEVYDELIQLGYIVDTQIGVSGYKIDLAVYSEEKGKYILGIECDGATYHSSKSARERDIQRQIYLESMGWRISRIWSRDWRSHKTDEIKKIDQLLKKLI